MLEGVFSLEESTDKFIMSFFLQTLVEIAGAVFEADQEMGRISNSGKRPQTEDILARRIQRHKENDEWLAKVKEKEDETKEEAGLKTEEATPEEPAEDTIMPEAVETPATNAIRTKATRLHSPTGKGGFKRPQPLAEPSVSPEPIEPAVETPPRTTYNPFL